MFEWLGGIDRPAMMNQSIRYGLGRLLFWATEKFSMAVRVL